MKCPVCDSALKEELNKRKQKVFKCTNALCSYWGTGGPRKEPKSGSGDSGTPTEKKVPQTPETKPVGKAGGDGPAAKPKSGGIFGIDFGF